MPRLVWELGAKPNVGSSHRAAGFVTFPVLSLVSDDLLVRPVYILLILLPHPPHPLSLCPARVLLSGLLPPHPELHLRLNPACSSIPAPQFCVV